MYYLAKMKTNHKQPQSRGDTEKPLPALGLTDDPHAPQMKVSYQGLDWGLQAQRAGVQQRPGARVEGEKQ